MKLTRTMSHHEEITLDLPAPEATARVVAILEKHQVDVDTSDPAVVRCLIGSGALNMNPAETEIRVEPVGDGRCRVVLDASAEEGLIKQRTAQKAIERIVAELR